jgi:hypothetical protein
MLRRCFLAVLAGLALLAVAAVEVSILVPLQTQVCSQNEQTHQVRCTVQNIMIAWLREFGELINYYSPSLTAIATIAIAAFTLTLWRATTKQAELTREAVALGNREFIATHRPRLVLRDAFSLISDPQESRITVFYTIANIGASVCWMTECHLGLDFHQTVGYPVFTMTPELCFPSHVPYIGRIEAGEQKQFTFTDPLQVWDQEHRQNYADTLGLHFVGRITYIDSPGSNVRRHVAFRRKYNSLDQRFHRIWEGDNEHEYAD